jgi:hypothetical protein
MIDLQRVAGTIRAKRMSVVFAVIFGAAIVGILMAYVRSQIAFVLVGPLVFFPWALLCVAFAHKPSNFSLACIGTFALAALAWPLLYI